MFALIPLCLLLTLQAAGNERPLAELSLSQSKWDRQRLIAWWEFFEGIEDSPQYTDKQKSIVSSICSLFSKGWRPAFFQKLYPDKEFEVEVNSVDASDQDIDSGSSLAVQVAQLDKLEELILTGDLSELLDCLNSFDLSMQRADGGDKQTDSDITEKNRFWSEEYYSNVKRFLCPRCPYSSDRKFNCQRHVSSIHGEEPPPLDLKALRM